MMSKEFPCVHWDNNKCKKFSEGNVTSWCLAGPCDSQQLSNADRIRAMSDEELDRCFGGQSICSYIQSEDIVFCDLRDSCDNCVKEWLQHALEGWRE